MALLLLLLGLLKHALDLLLKQVLLLLAGRLLLMLLNGGGEGGRVLLLLIDQSGRARLNRAHGRVLQVLSGGGRRRRRGRLHGPLDLLLDEIQLAECGRLWGLHVQLSRAGDARQALIQQH